jgi:UDP-N-acetylmuramyl pentapeptide phosphotransferase/UDP-N-acetylglucosamine-1-phosphate transferase
MRPRLYLISIIVAIVVSLLTYGKLDIFKETQINFLNKELILNSEIVISLIVLITLLFVLVIGLIDKLFSTKKPTKIVKKED